MRSFQITEPGGPDVLRYADSLEPVAGPGQVLIRVRYAGLNFTDVLARRGAPGYATAWPFVPGMEVAGTVAAVGDEVTGLGVGDRVVAFTPDGGGYADLAVADARLTAVVPDAVDLAAATTIPLTWATAVGLAHLAHVSAGDRVVVTSASGGVGVALASVLTHRGVTTIVGGTGSAGKASSLPRGVLPVVRGEDFYLRAVQAAGGPLDVVLDSVGGDVLGAAAVHLAVGGRLISYGGAAGQPDPDPVPFAALRAGNLTVAGFSILRLARTTPGRVQSLIVETLELVSHDLPLARPVVIDWEQLRDAHLAQSEGRATGKTVVALGG